MGKKKSARTSGRDEALTIARRVRQELMDAGCPWTPNQEKEQIRQRCQHLANCALEGLVADAWRRVEDAEVHHTTPVGQKVFPWMELDAVIVCGHNLRIAKRHAQRSHLVAHLAIDDKNCDDVRRANRAKHAELKRLDPYLNEGVTYEQACMAYLVDHPLPQTS